MVVTQSCGMASLDELQAEIVKQTQEVARIQLELDKYKDEYPPIPPTELPRGMMCYKEFKETMKMHKQKISTLKSLYNSTLIALPAIEAAAKLKTLSGMRRTDEDIMLVNTKAQLKRSKDELAQARHVYSSFLKYYTPINADVFKKTKQSLEADLTEAYEALRTAQIAVEELEDA